MSGLIYYVAAGILWAGLSAQLPDLWRNRRNPLKWSFCAVIFLSGLCFMLGAPPTVSLVNRAFDVPNIAALLTYGTVTAFSAASLILIVHWRGTDPLQIRRTARAWLTCYLIAIAAQCILFFMGSAPVERLQDFDTYYASTPFIREMILLYLLAHQAAAITTTVLCWRWTRQVKRWARASLVLLVLGWLFTSAYSIVKMVALTAHWLGHHWDGLSTRVAPLIAVGFCLTSAGYILPVVGQRIDSTITLIRLRPLFRLLAAPGSRPFPARLSWHTIGNVELKLTTRETAIRDSLKLLTGQLDDQIRQRARLEALAAGSSATEADVIGTAAMVAVAALADSPPRAPRTSASAGTIDVAIGDLDVTVSVGALLKPSAAKTQTLDTGQRSLLSLSRAVRTSIVDAAVQSSRDSVRNFDSQSLA